MSDYIEQWKDIEGYEGLYQVSNLGNVKSLARYKKNRSKIQEVKERIMKPSVYKNGYEVVQLSKDGKIHSFCVHRLVALAFVPNTENKPQINHLDENKRNNRADNLEWCTSKENNNYGTHNMRISLTSGTRVQAFDKDGNLVMEFHSIAEATRQTKINQTSICRCLAGKYKQAGGYVWKIVKEECGINE